MPYIRTRPRPYQVVQSSPSEAFVSKLIEAIRELHSVDYAPDASQHEMVEALNQLYELAGIEIVRLN